MRKYIELICSIVISIILIDLCCEFWSGEWESAFGLRISSILFYAHWLCILIIGVISQKPHLLIYNILYWLLVVLDILLTFTGYKGILGDIIFIYSIVLGFVTLIPFDGIVPILEEIYPTGSWDYPHYQLKWLLAISGVTLSVSVIALIVIKMKERAMVKDTDELMERIRNAFEGKLDPDVTKGTPLDRYNMKTLVTNNSYYDSAILEKTAKKLSLARVKVEHDFKEGYILIKYTCELYDKDGNRLRGSEAKEDAPAKLHIVKKDNKWNIVKIEEIRKVYI